MSNEAPYTPSDDDIRDAWVDFRADHSNEPLTYEEGNAALDRWLAKHDAEVRKAALSDAADELRNEMDEPWGFRAASRVERLADG